MSRSAGPPQDTRYWDITSHERERESSESNIEPMAGQDVLLPTNLACQVSATYYLAHFSVPVPVRCKRWVCASAAPPLPKITLWRPGEAQLLPAFQAKCNARTTGMSAPFLIRPDTNQVCGRRGCAAVRSPSRCLSCSSPLLERPEDQRYNKAPLRLTAKALVRFPSADNG